MRRGDVRMRKGARGNAIDRIAIDVGSGSVRLESLAANSSVSSAKAVRIVWVWQLCHCRSWGTGADVRQLDEET